MGPTLGKRRGGLPPASQALRSKLGVPGDPGDPSHLSSENGMERPQQLKRDFVRFRQPTDTRSSCVGHFPSDQPRLQEPSGTISRVLTAARRRARPPGDRDGLALAQDTLRGPALPALGWTRATVAGEKPPQHSAGMDWGCSTAAPQFPSGVPACPRDGGAAVPTGAGLHSNPRAKHAAAGVMPSGSGVVTAVLSWQSLAATPEPEPSAATRQPPASPPARPPHFPSSFRCSPRPPRLPAGAPGPAGTAHRPLARGHCLSPGTALRGQGCPCLYLLPSR